MITQECVHNSLCELSEDKKLLLSVQCAYYGVSPQKIEETITNVLNGVITNGKVLAAVRYWQKGK